MNEDTRIAKLRDYLLGVIDQLLNTSKYQINADMLSDKVNDFSLDKIPTNKEIELWITGNTVNRDMFSLRSRKSYSQDAINNLSNIGFFEKFENVIKYNNDNGILPDIDNIESIECLNCGTLNNANTNTAVFDIQIQITYRNNEINIASL